ncbi:MAG: hypothetical protein LBQ65_06445 [Tannerellaceae bacterium]|jgi:hypothetical protein|nr:hypothetical protein [Tannerellaceae bacterium]
MNRRSELKQRIRTSFPNKIHYFWETVSAKKIYVGEYEGDNTSHILKETDQANGTCIINILKKDKKTGNLSAADIGCPFDTNNVFTVINSRAICFIPIDGKGGLLGGTSNCDFIFFNKKNFCFVELKLNAFSLKEQSIRDNRRKAVEQLENTMSFFNKMLDNDYSGLKLEAYVATPDVYPRENTAFQSIKVKFLEDNGIDLFEGREKKY